ncbi:MAG: macro domain-containing protein [Bdellovibrionota bacterium]
MITFVKGDIFESPAQVLTNTVNCVGVMSKGIALSFKKRYPTMFADYKKKCLTGKVKIGQPYLWEDDKVQILNFPTKDHWKNNSELSYIEDGLKYLAENFSDMGICSLALAPLGCGNGGLDWAVVKPLIEKYLKDIPNLEVFAYVPANINGLQKSPDNDKEIPKMTHHKFVSSPATAPIS